jgi:hypothetical protein
MGNSNESNPYKEGVEDVFNIGKMLSHDKKFTLFFKTRDKAVLAKGEDFNYITDYPQDLYLFNNSTEKTKPLITYDWFPSKAKFLSRNYKFPVFPEDYAYYLLSDDQTIIMISAVKSLDSNFKYNIGTNTLEALAQNNRYNFMISSILKNCEFKNMNSLYECKYYKPLISSNLIN